MGALKGRREAFRKFLEQSWLLDLLGPETYSQLKNRNEEGAISSSAGFLLLVSHCQSESKSVLSGANPRSVPCLFIPVRIVPQRLLLPATTSTHWQENSLNPERSLSRHHHTERMRFLPKIEIATTGIYRALEWAPPYFHYSNYLNYPHNGPRLLQSARSRNLTQACLNNKKLSWLL